SGALGSAQHIFAAAGHIAASTVPVMIAMRLLLGGAEAIFFVAALAAATDLAPQERRGEAISLLSMSLCLGVAIGPVLSELLYGAGGFAWIWIAAAVISVAAV